MWEPASSSSVPVPTPNLEHLSHFWNTWVDSTLQHPSYWEENPGSGLTVGPVVESWPSLKLPSMVVLGDKGLPFSQVGGIPTSEREPHWWHTNRVPNNVIRKWLSQIKWFILFSCQGLCTHTNDHIQSFSSQLLILYQWLPNWVT